MVNSIYPSLPSKGQPLAQRLYQSITDAPIEAHLHEQYISDFSPPTTSTTSTSSRTDPQPGSEPRRWASSIE